MDQQNYQAASPVKHTAREAFRWYQPRVGLVDGTWWAIGSIERCLHRTLLAKTSATIKL